MSGFVIVRSVRFAFSQDYLLPYSIQKIFLYLFTIILAASVLSIFIESCTFCWILFIYAFCLRWYLYPCECVCVGEWVWVSVCVCVWVCGCGCVGVWVNECVGVWVNECGCEWLWEWQWLWLWLWLCLWLCVTIHAHLNIHSLAFPLFPWFTSRASLSCLVWDKLGTAPFFSAAYRWLLSSVLHFPHALPSSPVCTDQFFKT